MNRQTLIAYGRILFGALVFIAIITQLVDSISKGRNITNFFSFFTIQSNILAATVLLIIGFGRLAQKKGTPWFAFIRGAATLYMTMTGIIFACFYRGYIRRCKQRSHG